MCKHGVHPVTEIPNYSLSRIVHSYCAQMASLAQILYCVRIHGVTELSESMRELHVHFRPVYGAKIFLSLECYVTLFNYNELL